MKFGINLLRYRDQTFESWVYDGDRVELDTYAEAEELMCDYTSKKPLGVYAVMEIPVDG